MDELRNWAGNYKFSTSRLIEPENIEQLQQSVKSLNSLKVLGTRHSFNGIADSTENLISLRHFNRILDLDPELQTVTVEAGIKYGDLSTYLYEKGFALHNMASLPHISVAGAVATATHGSGEQHGSLSSAVRRFEMINASGELVIFDREQLDGAFYGAVVGLGGLGVVTKLTLDVVPAFQMKQDVYLNLPLVKLIDHFHEIYSSAYSVSLFTDWKDSTFNQLWMKSRISDDKKPLPTPSEFYGATLATTEQHPVPGHSAEHCSEQMGIAGPWHERMPHFRMDFTPSSGKELQSEYIVAYDDAYDALCAIDSMKQFISPLLLVSEVRTIAADSFWMSPFYHQKSVSIHFTWKDDWKAVQKILIIIEKQLKPFHARPHWGKLFTMQPEHIQSLYEKLPDFQQLLKHYDPNRKFMNSFLDTYLLTE